MLHFRYILRSIVPQGRMLLACSGAFLSLTANAQAENWMFRPSYYSHQPVAGDAPRGPINPRSAYREPFVGNHPHAAIRGGYRYNSMVLFNGNSMDRTVIRENWFDVNY